MTMPMAASSAMMPEMISAGESPGMQIMSRPTLHTAVMASSLVKVRQPARAASIRPASSVTGIKAPESPPPLELTMTPPYFPASFKRAKAAVVPWATLCPRPVPSKL